MIRELSTGLDGVDVEALQTLLFELGYTEVGTPDARFGDNTTVAVLRFQSEHGLPCTGVVDDASRIALVTKASTYGLEHLGTPLVEDAHALAYGLAVHHHEVHDLVTAPAERAHPDYGHSEHGHSDHSADGHIPADAPRSPDGYYWWDGAAWRPVHADAAATHAGHPAAGAHEDYADLLRGFADLTAAAIQHGGRTLDTVQFGPHLSTAHHTLLEHVRAAFIGAQADHAAQQRAAHDWPALEAQLQAAADEARHAGVAEESLIVFRENVAAVGEQYVGSAHAGPAHTESAEDYAELMTSVQAIFVTVDDADWDWTSGVAPTNITTINTQQQTALHAIAFGPKVTPAHRELLQHLREAFLLARTQGSARQALARWQATLPALRHALERAPQFGVQADTAWLTDKMTQMDEKLFHQGVIAEGEHRVSAHDDLATPDLPLQIKRLQEAAEGFSEVEKLIEKSQELTSEYALSVFLAKGSVDPALAHAIFEIAKNPHEIYEQFEEFQKKGVIEKSITVAAIADKMLAIRNGVMEIALETVHSFAKEQAADAAARGVAELAENWGKTAEWAEQRLQVLERVKTAGTVIAIAVGAVKVIDAIRRGEWGEALKEAASTGLGVAVGVVAGTAGTVALAGITVLVAGEMEGISGAAAMIRWARESRRRGAALSFIDVCTDALNIEARGIVEDAELLKDPANAAERQRIEAKLDSAAQYWRRHLHQLSGFYLDTSEDSVGGQPALKEALGAEAARVLANPGEGSELTGEASWENMARQIHAVFAGANHMATAFAAEGRQADATSE